MGLTLIGIGVIWLAISYAAYRWRANLITLDRSVSDISERVLKVRTTDSTISMRATANVVAALLFGIGIIVWGVTVLVLKGVSWYPD